MTPCIGDSKISADRGLCSEGRGLQSGPGSATFQRKTLKVSNPIAGKPVPAPLKGGGREKRYFNGRHRALKGFIRPIKEGFIEPDSIRGRAVPPGPLDPPMIIGALGMNEIAEQLVRSAQKTVPSSEF